ncbi:MAG: hypothetical protein D6820_02945 [Lentisphaerae bacterium]|nr:MAG: hypothetical protein D6820_02945 [Lentisphaerota bacterium]
MVKLSLPLIFENDHLFLEVAGRLWVFDTGAPTSFGETEELTLLDETFRFSANFMGLTAPMLSRYLQVECAGLLGMDILARFDHLMDIPGQTITISSAELSHPGDPVALEYISGVPVVTANIMETDYRMFFDTGAQLSYFQDDSLTDFPKAGSVTDFHPGYGPFETDLFDVDLTLGSETFILSCGRLPEPLGMGILKVGVHGVIGNPILVNRVTGFFPRRDILYL